MYSQPLVTVAMVTYNSARFVAEAIQSVLASSYINFELLISDDNSTDETWKIISGFTDERIKAIRNQTNLGEYKNRNECIKRASGKYLIFIDGDDILYPHGLGFMVKMMEAFPESGMALSRPADQRFIYPVELSPKEVYQFHYFDKSVLNLSFVRNFFRLAALRDVGGLSEKYRAGDDYIRLKIATKYKCLLINDGLAWWRKSEGQASEKLMRNDLGLIEQYQMKMEFLNSSAVPLTNEEVIAAVNNIKIKNAKHLLRKLVRLNVRGFYRLKNSLAFTFLEILRFSFVAKTTPLITQRQPLFSSDHLKIKEE